MPGSPGRIPVLEVTNLSPLLSNRDYSLTAQYPHVAILRRSLPLIPSAADADISNSRPQTIHQQYLMAKAEVDRALALIAAVPQAEAVQVLLAGDSTMANTGGGGNTGTAGTSLSLQEIHLPLHA